MGHLQQQDKGHADDVLSMKRGALRGAVGGDWARGTSARGTMGGTCSSRWKAMRMKCSSSRVDQDSSRTRCPLSACLSVPYVTCSPSHTLPVSQLLLHPMRSGCDLTTSMV